MKLVLQFDIHTDIIDVPQHIIDDKNKLQKNFFNWLYDRNNKHRYWVKTQYGWGVQYSSDAFIEWLNRKTHCNATIIEPDVCDYSPDLPILYF